VGPLPAIGSGRKEGDLGIPLLAFIWPRGPQLCEGEDAFFFLLLLDETRGITLRRLSISSRGGLRPWRSSPFPSYISEAKVGANDVPHS